MKDEYWEGFRSALDLVDIELDKLLVERLRSANDALLDAKNCSHTIRGMLPYDLETMTQAS